MSDAATHAPSIQLSASPGFALLMIPSLLVSSCTHLENWFDRDAALAVGHRLVDLVEAVETHQSIERKATLPIDLDERRNECLCDDVALDDPHDAAARDHHIVDVESDFCPPLWSRRRCRRRQKCR